MYTGKYTIKFEQQVNSYVLWLNLDRPESGYYRKPVGVYYSKKQAEAALKQAKSAPTSKLTS